MDTSGFEEGNYITADMVNKSPTKIGVILEEALTEKTDYGIKLQMKVSLDAKIKIYRPNTDSVANFQRAWGKDSKDWTGKKFQFNAFKAKGKDVVVAVPITELATSQ